MEDAGRLQLEKRKGEAKFLCEGGCGCHRGGRLGRDKGDGSQEVKRNDA